MKITRWSRTLATLVALCVTTSAGLATVTTSPAHAWMCSGNYADDADPGTDVVSPRAAPNLNVRSGPGMACSLRGSVPTEKVVDLWCYISGQNINGSTTWSYIRYGTLYGWVSDHYLVNGGSSFHC